jgi:multidrug efflux pump subunit AcrA (membrane-fusion protein)
VVSQANVSNLLSALVEVAGEYERHRAMQSLRRELRQVDAFEGFAVNLQRLTEERSLCFAIANELSQFVDCDRVTVLTRTSHWRVRAISHVDSWDKRSPLVVAAERLVSAVALHGEPVWLPVSAVREDSRAAECWQSYLDESTARAAALIPLVDAVDQPTSAAGAAVFGVLLLERFSGLPFLPAEQRLVQRYARHSAAALARASANRNVLRAWLARRTTILTMCVVAALALATQIPVDLEVSAEGHVRPVAQRNIFAPGDGQVRLLQVHEGDTVEAGAVLLELADDKLDFELTELTGEIRTARQQLATLQAARLDSAVPQRDQRWQLAAEEERIKQVLRGLEQQEQHLQERRDELTVRSPIAGRVITADVEQLLRSRPVRRGQQLLTIAAEQGSWVLELRVSDRDAGYVLAAQDAGETRPLRFVLATQPTQTRFATIEHISRWTEIDASGVASVRLTAMIDDPTQLAARPGATATAKIYCGRGRLGYVWFRDLIELLRARFMW